ncbi:MAG TPA: hypothetical protein VJU78_16835 [Chitinophagaceae bacterium]|nr:hypothetical protein [Chitinophagaceae bacterium]
MQNQRIFIQTSRLFLLPVIFFMLACGNRDKQDTQLIAVKVLNDYPSGSGLVYLDGYIYMIGDDATEILKLDSQFNVVDRTGLFISSQKRIPKEVKADLESIALIKLNKTATLLLPGSGSLTPYRNVCWIFNPADKEKKQYLLDTFYNRLKNEGIRDLNIEGAVAIPSGIILANRGNKSFPKNYLILTANRFWEKQGLTGMKIIKAGINSDTSFFAGISGLDYSYVTDQLLLTVSTEDTRNSYDDGAVGKSYLWIINDISSKQKLHAINPDKIIDLEKADPRFKGHKIESVCIVADSKREKKLVLVADDDKGGTVLFRMIL